MSADSYHKRKLGNRVLQPETQMMGYGYDPALSEGSLKPPIFLTSTFVFRNAQDGKDFFDYTSGRRQPPPGQAAGLVYSRFNNPNLEVLEDRLGLWEGGESAAVFSSGMSAISTTLWAYLKPSDVLLMSEPLYGGTETLIDKTMPAFGIGAVRVADAVNREAVMAGAKTAVEKAKAKGGKVGLLVTETPANPTNSLVDLQLWREASEWIADAAGRRAAAGRRGQHLPGPGVPEAAGAWRRSRHVLADEIRRRSFGPGGWRRHRPKAMVAPVRALRSSLGTQLDPNTSWMIMRSMETLALRMRASADNAGRVAGYLAQHPKVASVNYLGHLKSGDPRAAVFERQCQSAGSTFAFSIRGGEAEAFRMLDALQVMKLAVSLGGTETLISHPASTTHSGVPKETRDRMGVTDALIRISVGIENADDLIADLEQALAKI